MNKITGKKSDFMPVRDDGSRIAVCYGLTHLDEELYEWYELYFYKKQYTQVSFADIKNAILADINAHVKEKIVSGFVWNDNPVWLSEENQLNFSQAVVPATFKIGESEEGTPIYHTFETQEEMKIFSDACSAWKQQCLSEGWQEKDSIDWEAYKQALGIEEEETHE